MTGPARVNAAHISCVLVSSAHRRFEQSRSMRAAPHVVLSRTVGRLILWLTPRNQATRIPVHAALSSQTARSACFAKVETALGLIAQHDPARFHRLETDV